jgi:NADH-quinone oxidoreductase subunit J
MFSFFYFGTIIVLAAVLVVALRNPVYSVIALLIMFFHMAGLFITLHAEFLAAVQIIVYAGAILVLYLFVVMLLNLKRDDSYQRQVWLGVGLGGVALAEVVYFVISANVTVPSLNVVGQLPSSAPIPGMVAQGNTESIGLLLYTKYLFPFELASLILLVAMIGAILLAKKGIVEAKGDS